MNVKESMEPINTEKLERPTRPSRNFHMNFEKISTKVKVEEASKMLPLKSVLNLPCGEFPFTPESLENIRPIGQGNFGSVSEMRHKESNMLMAVKRIRSNFDQKTQNSLKEELNMVMNSRYEHIVTFYGTIFNEGDCWISMELMDISLDSLYKFVTKTTIIPDDILGKITHKVLLALNYLKKSLEVIHRDVKPSNILLDAEGHIKLCDFGISTKLTDSIAKTKDAGCRPYMAPERIDPQVKTYDIRSDVWSLGITLYEIATGQFPYKSWETVFQQLNDILNSPAPRIENSELLFSNAFVNFVHRCLVHNYKERPKYSDLLNDPYIIYSEKRDVKIGIYVKDILSQIKK